MVSYIVTPITREDFPRLAFIQHTAFADDPMTHAALSDVSKEDGIAWCERMLAVPGGPPGFNSERLCARDPASGEIGGWALWLTPLDPAAAPRPMGERPAPPPGIKEDVWMAMRREIAGHQEQILGNSPRWTLAVLAIDPALHRRGIGRLLVEDGIKRAHAQGLPVALSASPMGTHLYKALGFETKAVPKVESGGGFTMPVMVKELPVKTDVSSVA